jgi:hypothetical protein
MSEPKDMRLSDDGPSRRPAWDLPAELKVFEARLAALAPREGRLDRERLMFLAGRASAEVQLAAPADCDRPPLAQYGWPAAFATMTAVAATLLALLIARPAAIQPVPVYVADSPKVAPEKVGHAPGLTNSNSGMLSASDAHRRDFERLLSSTGFVAGGPSESVVVEPDGAKLTPAAWRQVIDQSPRNVPKTHGPSRMPNNSGATS